MKIGIGIGGYGGRSGSVSFVIDEAAAARQLGLDAVWMAQVFNHDVLSVLACVGAAVPDIELGTAVVPIYSRHPVTLAQQALTVQSASNNRLVLGVGLSHQSVVENAFAMTFDRPLAHMREYLDCLAPLLDHQRVDHLGDTVGARVSLAVPDVNPPPLLLAALAPKMLDLAGTTGAGTITWMTGPATIRSHIAPTISSAAVAAGRATPRVVVGLPVCVTDNEDQARSTAARNYEIYGRLPSYRAMLDREGASGPADVAIIGDATSVIDRICDLEAAGATDFFAACFGSPDEKLHTADTLAQLHRHLRVKV